MPEILPLVSLESNGTLIRIAAGDSKRIAIIAAWGKPLGL
jgi:hypothetical protein